MLCWSYTDMCIYIYVFCWSYIEIYIYICISLCFVEVILTYIYISLCCVKLILTYVYIYTCVVEVILTYIYIYPYVVLKLYRAIRCYTHEIQSDPSPGKRPNTHHCWEGMELVQDLLSKSNMSRLQLIFPARNLHFWLGFSMAMLNNQMVTVYFNGMILWSHHIQCTSRNQSLQ